MRSLLRNPKFALLLTAIMAASVWVYVQRVLIPYQVADAAAHERPRGILSDLYPRWLGTRELILDGRDPYSDEVTREIQAGYYGRVLDPNRPQDPKDQQRFAYPLYVVFLLAPLVRWPFEQVRVVFGFGLALLTALSVPLWLRALRYRFSRTAVAVAVLLVLGSLPAAQGIKLQQLSVLVAALIAACAALLSAKRLFLAGVFLALSTIKPQLAVLPAAWLLLWSLSDWHKRRNLVWGFFGSLLLLFAGAELLLPGWFERFLHGLVAYEHYTGAASLLDLFTNHATGTVLMIIIVIGTGVVGWRLRNRANEGDIFNLMLALVLAVTVLIVPMIAPYNQLLLVPAVFLILRSWSDLRKSTRLTRLVCGIAAVVLLWPWAASISIVLASFFLPAASVQRAWAVPLWASIGTPIVIPPLLLSLALGEFRRQRALAGTASPGVLSTHSSRGNL